MPTYFSSSRGTYVPANSSTRVHLTLLSETLSPAEISMRLGVKGDQQWKQGSSIRKGSRARHKFNGWAMESAAAPEAPVAEHVNDLLTRLTPRADRLRDLITDGTALLSAKLWIAHHLENWNPGFDLSPRQLSEIASLGVELCVDIYVYETGELASEQPLRIPFTHKADERTPSV